MIRFLLATALALALSACGPPPRTQDRLTEGQRQALVAAPMGHAESGDLGRARREFEILLARSDPRRRPDLLTAFGIGLYMLDSESEAEELRYRRASLHYLERAIPAARERFGARHPEVALALSDHAEVIRVTNPGEPPRQVDRLVAEAYHIRERALGPGNRETVASLFSLAKLRGLPSRTLGDSGRIAEAGKMFEDAIRGLEANRDPYSATPEHARYLQLEMYVRNGWVGKALDVARAADLRDRDRQPGCEIGPNLYAVAEALRKLGRNAEAEAAVRPGKPQLPECSLDAEIRYLPD